MQHDGDTTTDRRVTVLEAAKLLDITPDAVRARLRRGTLLKERAEDGTLLVVLEGTDPDRTATGRATEQPTDPYRLCTKIRISPPDVVVSGSSVPRCWMTTGIVVQSHPYITSLKSRIELLERELKDWKGQLEEEREANRENRRIIAGLVQRVPALEATPEPRESDVSASEERGGEEVPQERDKRRSWLYRFFFGT